jgi:hypothetical protein
MGPALYGFRYTSDLACDHGLFERNSGHEHTTLIDLAIWQGYYRGGLK